MFDAIDRFIDDFQTIVNIDSSSDYKPGIERVAAFFEARFSALGLATEVLFLGQDQVPCLKAATPTHGTPYDVMFLGHMDTVFSHGEVAQRPFAIKGSRAMGPGVCDMKGGLLVALHSLETMKRQGVLDQLSVCVCFNGDEETGSESSRDWIMSNAKNSRRVIVFEPCRPGYKLVSRRKGAGTFYVTVYGVKSHAGADPEKGINAVVEMAYQILNIHRINDPDLGTSVQVTVVGGGDKTNIIPDIARASVDVRISSLKEKERVENAFKALNLDRLFEGSRIRVTGEIERPPMEPTPQSQVLLDMILSGAKKLGIQMDHIATGGCSDGNFTALAGAPTIDGMGIVGANTHSSDEWADLDSIPIMVNLTANLCKQILNDK